MADNGTSVYPVKVIDQNVEGRAPETSTIRGGVNSKPSANRVGGTGVNSA